MLLTFTIQHPEYLDAWGAPPPGRPPAQHSTGLLTFSNLIVSHWYMLRRIGSMTEADLRSDAVNFFRGAIGREFWSLNGPTWMLDPDPLTRRFLDVLNEEFTNAELEGPPTPATTAVGVRPDPVPRRHGTSTISWAAAAGVSAGLIIGAALGYQARRRSRRPRQ